MQFLSNKPGSDGCRSSSGKSPDFKPVVGWETPVDNINSEDDCQKIISTANNILLLDQVFAKYKVHLEQTYSASGWAHKGQCPFDDHNDSTPSFGYNQDSSVFHCFGCHRGGKAVEFISYKEGRSKISVAKEILAVYGDNNQLSEIVGFDFEKMKGLLFEYADYVLSFKKKHGFSKIALDYAKSVNWSIDVYLRKNSNVTNIDLSSLEARLNKLKEQLDLFEEKL